MAVTKEAVATAGATFDAGQSTNTPLTPNSNAIAVATGDLNNTTNLSFMYNNMIPYWSPSVSSNNTTVTLGNDVGNGIVTFKKGLTVTFLGQSTTYTVIVDGQIVDSGSIYNIVGKSLGTFPLRKP